MLHAARRGLTLLIIAAVLIPLAAPGSPVAAKKRPTSTPYKMLFTNQADPARPGRWDPCTPITVRVDWANSYKGAKADIPSAFKKLHRATGLNFRDGGAVTPESQALFPESLYEIVIRFSTTNTSWAGLAAPVAVSTSDGRLVIIRATLNMNVNTKLARGFSSRHPSWGALLLHELGHIAGLAHVDSKQAMEPVLWNFASFKRGDLAGLKLLSAEQGCNPIYVTTSSTTPPPDQLLGSAADDMSVIP